MEKYGVFAVAIFIIFFLSFFISRGWASEWQFRDWEHFLSEIDKAPLEKRAEMARAFVHSHSHTFPITEKSKAIFIYHGKGEKLAVAGDFNNWQPVAMMQHLASTQLWYYSYELAMDARLEYKLVRDGEWFLDTYNQKKAEGGYGLNSDLWMPQYQAPAWLDMRPKSRGTLHEFKITSKNLKNTRKLQVYTPPDYKKDGNYPLLVVHDGSDYLKFAQMQLLVDHLIAEKRIKPILIAFIDPVRRFEEYGCSELYYYFTIEELVPFLERTFSISKDRDQRAFAGASMGGIVSFHLLYNTVDSFGATICQSGAFLFEPEDDNTSISDFLTKIDYSHLKKSKVWLDCGNIGELELSLLKGNRILRDKLLAAEIGFHYQEIDEAHNWGSWRKRMENALLYVFQP